MKIRRNLFFIITRIMAIFLMGLVVAFIISVSQLKLESLRGDLIAILQNATGLPIEINGDVSWKLSLRPRVQLNQVRVPNEKWAEHEYAFSAERIDVTLNLISLLRSTPTVQNIKIYDATVCIEQNSAGQYSITPKHDVDSTQTATDAPHPKYPFKDLGLGGVEVRGLAAHILDQKYNLSGLNVRLARMTPTLEYDGWIKSDDDVMPFIVSFSEYNAERRVYPMRVAVSSGARALIANIALEGTSKLPIDFIVSGDVPNVAAVGRIMDIDLSQIPSMRINIAGGMEHNKITLYKSSISVRGTDFTVSGVYDWSHATPRINVDIQSNAVSLMKLFPNMYGRPRVRPNRELNVFHDIPLFGDVFVHANIDAKIKLGQLLMYRDLMLHDLDATIKIKNGDVRIDASTVFADGNMSAAIDGHIEPDGFITMHGAATAEHVYVGNILSGIRINDIVSELPMNAEAYVQASGSNLSEFMASLTGPVRVYSVGDGYAHSKLVSAMYGTDFLTTLRHNIQDLFRSEKKYDQIKISCVAGNVKVRNGLIQTEHGVAAETNALNIRMAGDLDLGRERLKVVMSTVPTRGLRLSLTGNVLNSIEFSGNLAEPEIQISAANIAGKVASATGLGLLLAPFTGGIGLVAGAGVGLLTSTLLENWLADDTPCDTALHRGAPASRNDPQWMNVPLSELVSSVMDEHKGNTK